MTIVLISDTKEGAIIGLLDDIHLEVDAFKILREDLFLSIKAISLDTELLRLAAHDSDCVFRIVGNDNIYNIFTSVDI